MSTQTNIDMQHGIAAIVMFVMFNASTAAILLANKPMLGFFGLILVTVGGITNGLVWQMRSGISLYELESPKPARKMIQTNLPDSSKNSH